MVIAFIIIFVIIIFMIAIGKINKTKRLKREYDDALWGDNKRKALEKGRAYYASLRSNGKLTIYDEQAITNDISTMKNAG
jgi:hypothetical protein